MPEGDLQEAVSVELIGPDEYQSKGMPSRMGEALKTAYGGFTIAVAIRAAYATVDKQYIAYSIMGNYLGPALLTSKLRCRVRRIRDTRTFATRLVEVFQEQQVEGASETKLRPCMLLTADFQVAEKFTLFTYSTPPSRSYSPPEKCMTMVEAVDARLREGVLTPDVAVVCKSQFAPMTKVYESRYCPEGVLPNNIFGLLKEAKTPQDDVELRDKSSADWIRALSPLESAADNYAGIGYILDGTLAFLPLSHSNMFLFDVQAASSLDFALRFFTLDASLDDWLLRELRTVAGGNGRTYSEARLWDKKGNLVANMTQQSIMRPYKPSL